MHPLSRELPRPLLNLFLAIVFVVGAAGSARAQTSVDLDGARAFMDNLGQQTIAILSDPARTPESMTEQFSEVFSVSFDTRTIGRFVLGTHWRSASEAQQTEYLDLFREMIVQTYARRFSDYSGEQFVVDGARPEGERDALVQTRIIRPDGPPVAVGWRLRPRDDTFVIIDVVVEGVSMLVTQRNDFAAVIQRNGGRVDALLDALRQQIAQARAG